ncbi:MAG: hypothetical protein PVH63_07930 [Balneolaceae bacterium]|jgi:hypothetical protein
MKRLALTFCALLLFVSYSRGQSRELEKSFMIKPTDKIRLDLKIGNHISVKSWDKNQVSFKAVVEINNGKLNDAFKLKYEQENGWLRIASDYDKKLIPKGEPCDCSDPESQHSWSSWNGKNGRYMMCSKIRYEIYVPENADLNVESISSDIELVNLAGPIRAKSISGFVDLSWPSDKSANIAMKTISGEAYTDLENITFDNKKRHIPIVGYELRGNIGSGGPHISLESVSGNIYLRRVQS